MSDLKNWYYLKPIVFFRGKTGLLAIPIAFFKDRIAGLYGNSEVILKKYFAIVPSKKIIMYPELLMQETTDPPQKTRML